MGVNNDIEAIEAELRRAVREAMEREELTQGEVARALGVSRSRVGHLLSGARGRIPKSLLRLLDVLGLELVVQRKRD